MAHSEAYCTVAMTYSFPLNLAYIKYAVEDGLHKVHPPSPLLPVLPGTASFLATKQREILSKGQTAEVCGEDIFGSWGR
jgi:hypothetical protein